MANTRFIRLAYFLIFISHIECQVETKEGVKIEIITPSPSDCIGIRKGDWVQVLFNMTSQEGDLISSTYRADKKPIAEEYYFGVNVTNGVTIGLEGACKGEKRRLTMPSTLMFDFDQRNPLFNSSLFYEAYILDHVLAENKLGLLEFWAADWNSDKVVDLEEIDMSLKRNKYLEKYLQETIGVENMSDWMMDVFDHNGDEMLDRDEFFHMYKVIRPDEMNKTMN
ncbi:uncharacterized protein LOC125680798, partial [Ostrea edulis]|uniref:uncharacterized protein LOC125680798 n=1 Tax=Ostrea edulis TaxID=37623 RepID=UPI0024AFADFF